MNKRCLCLLAATFSCSAIVSAQRQFSGQWTPESITIPSGASGIRIDVTALGVGSRWVLGIKAGDASSTQSMISVSVAKRPPVMASAKRTAPLLDIFPAARATVGLGPGYVSLPPVEAGSALLVYVVVPKGAQVTVDGARGPIVDAVVTDSLIVRSGRIVPASLLGPQLLPAILNSPSTDSPEAAVPSYTNSLRGRILSYVDLGSLDQPTQPALFANVQFLINQRGEVENVTGAPLAGKPDITAAIQSWRFRPAAQPVTVNLPIFIGDDGKHLICALIPGAVTF